MKPSERIDQILKEKYGLRTNTIMFLPLAIELYLDEQWENDQIARQELAEKIKPM